jgi:thiazole synthase
MELGCDAILAATAVASAREPELMATALRAGVEAGLTARRAGRAPRVDHTRQSTPDAGLPDLAAT